MSYFARIFDRIAARYLSRRAVDHSRAGEPPIAVFAFDRIGHEVALKGRADADALDCAFAFLHAGGLIQGEAVDVGANVGSNTLYFAEHYANVVALEPNPRVFEVLELNVKMRKNIRALNIGASDVSKRMSLGFDAATMSGGQLWTSQPDASRAFTVPVKVQRLDDVAELADHPVGLLKLDAEGHELRALKGAASMIARSRPVVIFGLLPHESKNGSGDVVDWLRSNGYKTFYEVRSLPGLPRTWRFPGHTVVNGLLSLLFGERKHIVPVKRFEPISYPMVLALPNG